MVHELWPEVTHQQRVQELVLERVCPGYDLRDEDLDERVAGGDVHVPVEVGQDDGLQVSVVLDRVRVTEVCLELARSAAYQKVQSRNLCEKVEIVKNDLASLIMFGLKALRLCVKL